MSITVCLSTNQTLNYPQGGGHLWVYLNWALGLRALGCEVIWLETVSKEESVSALNRRRRLERDGLVERPSDLVHEVQANVATLKRRLERYGLAERLALYDWSGEVLPVEVTKGCLDLEAAAEADLLLNLRYDLPGEVVERFRRSALLDIDPGLLQIWMSQGLISVPQHDFYFTIGETVGQPGARFPDLGLKWHYTPPPVYLPEWPPVQADSMASYTTVSHWWEPEPAGWVEVQGELRNNEKRTAFLNYLDLPSRTSTQLELALCLGPSDEEEVWLLEGRAGRFGMRGPSVRNPSSTAPIFSNREASSALPSPPTCGLTPPGSATARCATWLARSPRWSNTRVSAASCRTRKVSFGSGTWKKPPVRSPRWSQITSDTAGWLANWQRSTLMLRESLNVCWSGRWHERAMFGPRKLGVPPCVVNSAIGASRSSATTRSASHPLVVGRRGSTYRKRSLPDI